MLKKVTGTEQITSREAHCWLACRWTSRSYTTEVNCLVRNMVDGPSRESENRSPDLLLYLRKVHLILILSTQLLQGLRNGLFLPRLFLYLL